MEPALEGTPAATTGRVGPNAVIQVAAALRAAGGERAARAVFAAAGLEEALASPPARMVDERSVARLHTVLAGAYPPDTSTGLAEAAGRRTADYILANRIPKMAQWLLRALPPGPSARLLLSAIRSNAWTFAGSGEVTTEAGAPCIIRIAANPIATPGCPWHCGVFERLFEALVSQRVSVAHTACCALGAGVCRFEIAVGRAAALPLQGGALRVGPARKATEAG